MMFNPIIIQEIGDQESPFAYAISDMDGNVIREELDGDLNRKATAKGIVVVRQKAGQQETERILALSDVDIEMYVTDCRVIFRCLEYDKGDGKWRGGLTAVALNAYEKHKAQKRSAGKMLLGHIRYEWLYDVQFRDYTHQAFLESDLFEVRFAFYDKEKNFYIVAASFKKGMDTQFIANEVVHLACRYRLCMRNCELDEKERSFLTKYLTESIPRNEDNKKYSTLIFPFCYQAPSGKTFQPDAETLRNYKQP